MSLALWAEWLRFRRSRANVIIVATYCAVLILSGLWSAHGAQQHRHGYAQEEATRDALISNARNDAQPSGGEASLKAAAMQAFVLGRSKAGLAQLQALPGLALSLSPYSTLNTRIAVSVESRYADGRRSDALTNPVLDQIGAMDLAAIVILLMPLAAIGLCAGVVQEDRERGTWRMVISQSARPGRPFAVSLGIRTAALFIPAAVACGLAMVLDAGSAAWPAVAWWSLCLGAYACFWVAVCGLIALFPISSAASVLLSLTVWLLLTFAVPAGLESIAAARDPIPSRLVAVVQLREAQQDAEVRMPELLDAWYARHPDWPPLHIGDHTWPVTFLPRFEHQDEQLRPLMRKFDQQRLAQAGYLERRAWLAPPMSLLLIADHLAGISALRYATFVSDVDRYEQAWRSFFVPRVMSYRGLSVDDYQHIPRFDAGTPCGVNAALPMIGGIVLSAGMLWALLLLCWPRAARRP